MRQGSLISMVVILTDVYSEELVVLYRIGSKVVRAISKSWHAREPKPGRKSYLAEPHPWIPSTLPSLKALKVQPTTHPAYSSTGKNCLVFNRPT